MHSDFKEILIDHIANLPNDAWWEGRGMHLMHCGKEKDEICALDPPCIILGISDMVYAQHYDCIMSNAIRSCRFSMTRKGL